MTKKYSRQRVHPRKVPEPNLSEEKPEVSNRAGVSVKRVTLTVPVTNSHADRMVDITMRQAPWEVSSNG